MKDITKTELPTSGQFAKEIRRIRYQRDFRKILLNTISSLIIVTAAAVLISMMLLPVLRVTGSSMMPSLQNDEMIICGKRNNFRTGDIVAFYFNNKILLKRVIGVAGDEIDLKEDGTVYLNGEVLEEPYIEERAFGECDIELPYRVPEGRVFVMGDQRTDSVDSRSSTVGCIADEYIIGRVILRVFPLQSIHIF